MKRSSISEFVSNNMPKKIADMINTVKPSPRPPPPNETAPTVNEMSAGGSSPESLEKKGSIEESKAISANQSNSTAATATFMQTPRTAGVGAARLPMHMF